MFELTAGRVGSPAQQLPPPRQPAEALGACSDEEGCMDAPGRALDSPSPAAGPGTPGRLGDSASAGASAGPLNTSLVDMRAAAQQRQGVVAPMLQQVTSFAAGPEDWMFSIGAQQAQVLHELAAAGQDRQGRSGVPEQPDVPYRLQPR